jgi:hypothetical protein
MATREYAVHQKTARFFEARSHEALAEQIMHFWDHREVAEQVGQQARKEALKLKDRRMIVFKKLFECCLIDLEKGVQR